MDIVHTMDKQYQGKGAVRCPNDGQEVLTTWKARIAEHGTIAVHGSGAYLMCGICGAKVPTGTSV